MDLNSASNGNSSPATQQQQQKPARFVLQSDWDTALRQKDKKIWIGYQETGAPKPSYFDLIASDETRDCTQLISSDPRVKVTVNGPQIQVQAPASGDATEFLAPSAVFKEVHKHNVYSLDVSQGGLGVSSCAGGKLSLWSSADGTLQRQLEGHVSDVYRCRFFPSGAIVLSAGADMQLKIWATETAKCAQTLRGHTRGVSCIDFVDVGKNVLSGSLDGSVRLWDCGSAACIATIEPQSGIVWALNLMSTVDDSPPPGAKAIDDRETGTVGKRVLFGTETGHLFAYDLGTRDKICKLECDGPVLCCEQMSENRVMCGTDKGTIYFFDLRDNEKPLLVRQDNRGKVLSVVRGHGGFYASFNDGSVGHWPQGTAREAPRREFSGADCTAVNEVTPDEKQLFTCAKDGIIRKYNVK